METVQNACKCCGSGSMDYLGEKSGYRFWECGECKFIFTDGVKYDEMVQTYRQGYHDVSEGAPEKGWRKDFSFLQPALDYFDREKLNILDFGCGQCNIWLQLRENGHNAQGIDIVPPLRSHPDRFTGDILEARLRENTYDLIYSFQVFEHIPKPVPIINELLRILKPGGVLFIHTDMEVSDRQDGFLNWWYVLPPDHCSFYRHRTFGKILENTPHEMVYKDEKAVMIRKNSSVKDGAPHEIVSKHGEGTDVKHQ